MTDITKRLPPEVLGEILGHVSVPEVLRLKEVNRPFRNAIAASLLIQHKIELFSAGLEYNAAAGIELADSKKAFLEYRSNLDSFQPSEEVTLDGVRQEDAALSTAAGGVYAIVSLRDGSLWLLTLGSISRGVPYQEWEIPLPVNDFAGYGFDPAADVIAFVKISSRDGHAGIKIHLRTLSDGRRHPDARTPSIRYSREDTWPTSISSVLMTSSRLAVRLSGDQGEHLIIVNWRNARALHSVKSEAFGGVEFIDDYRLLIGIGSMWSDDPSSSLLLVDTENIVDGRPMETTFQLPFDGRDFLKTVPPPFTLERGAHKPTPAESSASFYQDPSQRIIALQDSYSTYFVFRAEALLELAEKNKGETVRWDDWKDRVVVPSIDSDRLVGVRVSGCRLFVIHSMDGASGCQVEVYDFSMQGRAKYLVERRVRGLDVERFLRPSGAICRIPPGMTQGVRSGHDSIVFSVRPLEEMRRSVSRIYGRCDDPAGVEVIMKCIILWMGMGGALVTSPPDGGIQGC